MRSSRNRIRAVLAGRGENLRTWAFAWGRRRGLEEADLQNEYNTVKRTVERWAHRRDRPRPGTKGAEIMAALRADLGAWVIPSTDDLPRLQAPRRLPLSPTRGRHHTQRIDS